MGAYLDTPKTEKHSAHGDGNGLRYGLSSMQGWRREMEDAHTAVVKLPKRRADWSFFAVYDGHAGSRVADYCSGHMLDHILPSGGTVEHAVKQGFLRIDEQMRCLPAMQQQGPEPDRSGCTAVGVLISPDHVYFINCGDARAVLSRGGRVGFFTKDHKPCDPRERERIQNAGGHVTDKRVNGSLGVSRALGDYEYKGVAGKGPTEQPVSAEPEVFECKRDTWRDEFVVLACDGVWDVMSNEELCDFVRSRLQVHKDLEKVCNEVVDTCLHKGSSDNMSVVLVCFPGAPKVECKRSAGRNDKKLDTFLETRVKELLQCSGGDGVPDLMNVVQSLTAENISNLPPGGGLASKRSVIDAMYNKLKLKPGIPQAVCQVQVPADSRPVPAPVPAQSTNREDFLKHSCSLSMDPSSMNNELSLSENNRKVTSTELQHHPDNLDRFTHYPQVLSSERLPERCYFEVKWSGRLVSISLCYPDINRKDKQTSGFGRNDKSCMLFRCRGKYWVMYKGNKNQVGLGLKCSDNDDGGVFGVYVDHTAGRVSFYSVSDNRMSLIHTDQLPTNATQPLHAGIYVPDFCTAEVCKIW